MCYPMCCSLLYKSTNERSLSSMHMLKGREGNNEHLHVFSSGDRSLHLSLSNSVSYPIPRACVLYMAAVNCAVYLVHVYCTWPQSLVRYTFCHRRDTITAQVEEIQHICGTRASQ